jgi:hypothetical protein
VHAKNNFIAASKYLARYRSENDFMLSDQNNCVGNFAANSFDVLATKLNIRYNFLNGLT